MACQLSVYGPCNFMPPEISVEFTDLILNVETDTAKHNLTDLFTQELGDDAKSLQLQVGVKDAACWVLSHSAPGTGQRYGLEGALNSLWRKACIVREMQTQLPKDSVRSTLDPMREKFDDIAKLQDLSTLGSEELFQLLRNAFFRENNMTEGTPPCPSITREEAGSRLVQSFGKECVNFDPSQSLIEWLNKFLALSYDGQTSL